MVVVVMRGAIGMATMVFVMMRTAAGLVAVHAKFLPEPGEIYNSSVEPRKYVAKSRRIVALA